MLQPDFNGDDRRSAFYFDFANLNADGMAASSGHFVYTGPEERIEEMDEQ